MDFEQIMSKNERFRAIFSRFWQEIPQFWGISRYFCWTTIRNYGCIIRKNSPIIQKKTSFSQKKQEICHEIIKLSSKSGILCQIMDNLMDVPSRDLSIISANITQFHWKLVVYLSKMRPIGLIFTQNWPNPSKIDRFLMYNSRQEIFHFRQKNNDLSLFFIENDRFRRKNRTFRGKLGYYSSKLQEIYLFSLEFHGPTSIKIWPIWPYFGRKTLISSRKEPKMIDFEP